MLFTSIESNNNLLSEAGEQSKLEHFCGLRVHQTCAIFKSNVTANKCSFREKYKFFFFYEGSGAHKALKRPVCLLLTYTRLSLKLNPQ